MDFEKLLKFSTEYLSDYFWVFAETLRSPILRFRPLLTPRDGQSATALASRPGVTAAGPRLNPKLLSFVFISIFVGLTINALIPERKVGKDFVTTAVIVLAYWLFFSCVTHWVCRLLRGRGTFVETLSVSLQLFAVLYVVSSFAAFIWGVLVAIPQLSTPIASLCPSAELLVKKPFFMYFIFQFVILAIYLPIALKHVHGFGWLRQLVLAVSWVIVIPVWNVVTYQWFEIPIFFLPPLSQP